MGLFGNKENKFAVSFFELAHEYGVLSNQKKSAIVAVINESEIRRILADLNLIIREQRKRLDKIKAISSGRLQFIKDLKEILPTLKTHEIESTDYGHFAEIIIPVINFALQNELVQATDYYKNQICPLLYEEYRKVYEESRKYTELGKEESKDEEILKIEETILADLEKYLQLQEKSILAVQANTKNSAE